MSIASLTLRNHASAPARIGEKAWNFRKPGQEPEGRAGQERGQARARRRWPLSWHTESRPAGAVALR